MTSSSKKLYLSIQFTSKEQSSSPIYIHKYVVPKWHGANQGMTRIQGILKCKELTTITKVFLIRILNFTIKAN